MHYFVQKLQSSTHQEFNLPLWMVSMDMRKAVDTIDHPAVIRALRSRGFPEAYVALLSMLYANQMASVNGSSNFPIQRGVKQGDILSAILFNCVLDVAFDEWRRSLDQEGLYTAQRVPRPMIYDLLMIYSSMQNH